MKRVSNRLGENPKFTQGVFLATFVLGVLAILSLKALGTPQIVVTSVPILLMAAYASLVFVPPVRLRPDQTGDNVYYLGFLFTLVSLGWSLHQFSVENGVDQIVQNFGIAISSTIAGVAGRVLLNQMRTDPWEVERSTRLALADSARNLRSELDNSIIEFNAYRRQVQQAASDGIRELQDIASRQLEGSSDRLEKMVTETATRVETVVGEWSNTAQTFNERSSAMADAMAKLGVRLEAVRAPAEIIEEKIAPAGEAVTRLAAAAEGAASNIQSALGRLEAGATELGHIVGGAREMVELARSHSQVLSQAGSVLESAKGQVNQLEATAARFEAGLNANAKELTSGLIRFVDRLDKKLAAAHSLAEAGDSREAEEVAANIARMAAQIEQLVRAQNSELSAEEPGVQMPVHGPAEPVG